MQTNKHLIIGTTAINRPKLHNRTLNNWIKWVLELGKGYKVKWFMNIDIIEKLPATLIDTKKNMNELLGDNKDYFDMTYLDNGDNLGSFKEACKRISDNIVGYCSENKLADTNVRVLWLEDDWVFYKQNSLKLSYILEKFSTDMSNINLSFIRNNYIWALAPCIIGYKFWKQNHYMAWKQAKIKDPEHSVGLYFIKNNCKESLITNLTIINKRVGDKFLNNKCFQYKNSKHTFVNDRHITGYKKEQYININKVKETLGETVTFIRITPTFCADKGREFMESLNLVKGKNIDVKHYEDKTNTTPDTKSTPSDNKENTKTDPEFDKKQPK